MTTFTADQLITDEGAPRVRFAARERRGIFLGLTFLQLVVIGAAVAVLLATLFIDPNAFWVMLPIIAVVIFFAARHLPARTRPRDRRPGRPLRLPQHCRPDHLPPRRLASCQPSPPSTSVTLRSPQ